jgi:hypothetical protein
MYAFEKPVDILIRNVASMVHHGRESGQTSGNHLSVQSPLHVTPTPGVGRENLRRTSAAKKRHEACFDERLSRSWRC